MKNEDCTDCGKPLTRVGRCDTAGCAETLYKIRWQIKDGEPVSITLKEEDARAVWATWCDIQREWAEAWGNGSSNPEADRSTFRTMPGLMFGRDVKAISVQMRFVIAVEMKEVVKVKKLPRIRTKFPTKRKMAPRGPLRIRTRGREYEDQ